jgi:tRNA G18 (ribose-2'-O)-methylase SpoU
LNLKKEDNIIITFGSENKGMDEDLYMLTDYNVYIPPSLDVAQSAQGSFNYVDSLNVSVSAGIIINYIKSKLK